MYATLGLSPSDPNVSIYDVDVGIGGYMLDIQALCDVTTACKFANEAPSLTLGCNAHHCNIVAARSGMRPAPIPRGRELSRNMRRIWVHEEARRRASSTYETLTQAALLKV